MYSHTYWGQRFRTFFWHERAIWEFRSESLISQSLGADASICVIFRAKLNQRNWNRFVILKFAAATVPSTMLIFCLVIDHGVLIRQTLCRLFLERFYAESLHIFYENPRFPSGVYKLYFYYDMYEPWVWICGLARMECIDGKSFFWPSTYWA